MFKAFYLQHRAADDCSDYHHFLHVHPDFQQQFTVKRGNGAADVGFPGNPCERV